MKLNRNRNSLFLSGVLAGAIILSGCTNLDDINSRLDAIEVEVSNLKDAVSALESAYRLGKVIVSVDALDNSVNPAGGWKIAFSDGSFIILNNGKDGQNGIDGADGINGADGSDGADGITPVLKIDHNGLWIVSYDNGLSYSPVLGEDGTPVSALGKDGADGAVGSEGISLRIVVNAEGRYVIQSYLASQPDVVISETETPYLSDPACIITSITHDNTAFKVVITLADGRVFEFPMVSSSASGIVVLSSADIMIDPQSETQILFRVNPSDADINFNVADEGCQIALDLVGDATRGSLVVTEPDCFSLVEVTRSIAPDGSYIPGQYAARIKDNGTAVGYTRNVVIVVSAKGSGQISSSPLVIKSSFYPEYFATGLPLVVVDTPDANPIVSKDDWMKDASISVYDDCGHLDFEGSLAVKGRGNTTWGLPKNPYALKFDSKNEILGMPKHKRWCLLADYLDPSYLRNNLTFWIGNEISTLDYTPRTREVNLVLNGKFCGQYLLTEQLKIDKNRVNAGDDGFLMEIDKRASDPGEDDPYFRVQHIAQPIAVKDYDETEASLDFVKDYLTRADNLLFSDNYLDPVNGWKSMIDMDSFVEWYLINEITKNNDAVFFSSCYMNLKRDGKLKMGPLWDYDLSMGNYSYGNIANDVVNNPEGLYVNSVPWIARMMTDPEFMVAVKSRFNDYYANKQRIFDQIDNIVEHTDKAYTLDFDLWRKTSSTSGLNVYRLQKTAFLKNWLDTRLNWMKAEFDKL